jgi:ectoine hydroxylase-related dioxygenase (phytanoyl-CoA dioxygenase family)
VPLKHLPPTSTTDEVVTALRADGACIVDHLASDAVMDQVAEEMEPYIDLTPEGRDNFIGRLTRRTGSMIARSPSSRNLIMHPLVLGTTAVILEQAFTFQLHLTQVISVFPGETEQPLHQDQGCDGYPFPPDYDIQCSTIWAMTDFTADNGATKVLAGSHLLPAGTTVSEALEGRAIQRAEMERGSVFFYTGKVWHGAGANQTDQIRQGINLTYCLGWIRQEENQYLSTPLDVARTLDDDLLKLMGYQLGGHAIGYVRDFEDPMVTVRDLPKVAFDFEGQVRRSAAKDPAARQRYLGWPEAALPVQPPA